MSEDQELLARIGKLAGHINLHKAQPSPPPSVASGEASSSAFRPQVTRAHVGWKSPRPAPYGARARGAQRRHPTSHSLVLNKEKQTVNSAPSSATPDELGALQPAAAYVSKRGRHKQLINASILDKVTQQRKHAMEETQQRKVLVDDQMEQKRMSQYIEGLDASSGNPGGQPTRTPPGTTHHQIEVDGLYFQILKNGSKLARIYGANDTSLRTPKRLTIHGVVFIRSKHGNLYRSGMVRARTSTGGRYLRFARDSLRLVSFDSSLHFKMRCSNDVIRRHIAQRAEASHIAETNDSDISSEEDDDVDTDGEDIDSDDLSDHVIEGVDALGRQALAEQHDFVGF
ncbi:MAG: hypothetical protein Q9207_002461 [Kuettlingeria erythrocarpa]